MGAGSVARHSRWPAKGSSGVKELGFSVEVPLTNLGSCRAYEGAQGTLE